MKTQDPSREAQDAVRQQLVAAAHREAAQTRSSIRRRPRRRRRAAGIAVVALLGATAAASATGLISVGDPLADDRNKAQRYRPATPGSADLVATAPDPEWQQSWGVGIYTAANGDACAIAGQVRGVSLGRMRDGRFRPYATDTVGACADLGQRNLLLDTLTVRGPQPRTILFGRTRTPEKTVVIYVSGKRYAAEPGRGGGFLFVFSGTVADADLSTDPN